MSAGCGWRRSYAYGVVPFGFECTECFVGLCGGGGGDMIGPSDHWRMKKFLRLASRGCVPRRVTGIGLISRKKVKMATQGNKIGTFDVTIPQSLIEDQKEVVELLRHWGSAWVFQLEEGAGGLVHWQCRIRLKVRRRMSEVKKHICPKFPGHWSPTSNPGSKAFDYVMKEDGRKEGPWKDTDPVRKLTRQLTTFRQFELRPWQRKIKEICGECEDRWITVVFDNVGNIGKSIFCEWAEFEGFAFEVPPMREIKDLMGCVIENPDMGAYLVDMPRGMKKDKLGEFYSGLECIKNGMAWDPRYKFRKVRFDRPQVVVFTNTMPVLNLLSKDRWKVFQTTQDYDLIELDLSDDRVVSEFFRKKT